MEININESSKETFVATEVSAVAIWSSPDLDWVRSEDVYDREFNNVFTIGQSKLSGSAVIINTGIDGSFKTILHKNEELTENEKKKLYKSEKGFKLEVKDKLYLGSPQWVGYNEKKAENKGLIKPISVEPGKYIVDTHSLLVTDKNNKLKYIEFVFCIYDENKYHGENEIRNFEKTLELRFKG